MNKKIFWLLLLFIIQSISIVAQEASSKPPYDDELLKVEGRLVRGDIYGAIADLEQITTKFPKAAEVYYAKALLYEQTGQIDAALLNSKQAYIISPSITNAVYLLNLYKQNKESRDSVINLYKDLRGNFKHVGGISRDLIYELGVAGRHDEALKVYDDEVKMGYKSDTLEVSKAWLFTNQKKYDEALSILKPLQGKSKFWKVYEDIAYIYQQKKLSKPAVEVIQEGLMLTNNPLLKISLAEVYELEKKSKDALALYRSIFTSTDIVEQDKYLVLSRLMNNSSIFTLNELFSLSSIYVRVHPESTEAKLMNAELSIKMERFSDARLSLVRVVRSEPHNITAWRLLLWVDMEQEMLDEAISHGLQGLEANPRNPILLYLTGVAYVSKPDLVNGRKMLEEALNYSDDNNVSLKSSVYTSLGDLYHQLKMDNASDVAYEEAIHLDSTNVLAMNNLAYYLSTRKVNLDKALAYSKLVNELAPDSPNYLDTHAWVLFQKGAYKEALQFIEQAVNIGVSDVILEHYGDILSMLGRDKEAVKQWGKALSIKKGDKSKIEQKIKLKKYVE